MAKEFAMKVMDAAELIETAYLDDFGSGVQKKPSSSDGAQAYLLSDGTLVIPGTNEPTDWTKYNLNFFSLRQYRKSNGIRFHSGFLTHAQSILSWARDKNVKCITGHSLGAASAQILGPILNAPTICFASPKVSLKQFVKYRNEERVLCFNRKDDMVANVGGWLFRHLGRVESLDPKGPHIGGDHKVKFYKELLVLDRYKHLPQSWP
ncbi:MAG: hypothetical protein GY952_15930 [Rhodobacteraceae bacterium]|nr:hypothetical protein [Paracoccaceae bacterium]